MRASKLTLTVDQRVVAAAKRYARRHDTSVSQLVEGMLVAVTAVPEEGKASPLLERLRGSLAGAKAPADPRASYRDHLRKKYE